eukprot:CAMPEP_0206432718 /NCGR_PEP_ID=MMETSP0324_2-20121206/8122_1 /ASSEMBLY_ACC=CAM_ASM_000836 /TAXON_ID=2866 /ORGANISM="Crypthecodinium cohnii, Strain Seligo" /LENGTH=166 /DNA_ID=CAMNT_0053898881 /DNA_START=424 /DNA_END=925 /DNA_ORIENTATION=-
MRTPLQEPLDRSEQHFVGEVLHTRLAALQLCTAPPDLSNGKDVALLDVREASFALPAEHSSPVVEVFEAPEQPPAVDVNSHQDEQQPRRYGDGVAEKGHEFEDAEKRCHTEADGADMPAGGSLLYCRSSGSGNLRLYVHFFFVWGVVVVAAPSDASMPTATSDTVH